MPEALIITGTTQGLGRELATILADKNPLVINRRSTDAKNEVLCDLTKKENVDAVATILKERFQKDKEILFIANAAVYGNDEDISDITPQEMAVVLYTNVFSQLSLVEGFLKTGKKVRLVAISSQMGSVTLAPEPYHYAYGVSKAGLNLSTRLMKSQYPNQLDYLLINPGWMPTQMGGSQAPDEPAIVAQNIKKAIEASHTWNNQRGTLNVNNNQVDPW